MSDYRINVKVRNARLLRAIEDAGYTTGGKFADIVGISYQGWLFRYVNLAISPYDKAGNLRPSAEKLCVFLNKGPDELWSEEQLEPIITNKSERDVSAYQLSQLMYDRESNISNPELLIEQKENIGELDEILETLNPREQEILRLHHGIDCEPHTLSAIGRKFNLSIERIRQIECRALRRLRHPDRSNKLRSIASSLNIDLGERFLRVKPKPLYQDHLSVYDRLKINGSIYPQSEEK